MSQDLTTALRERGMRVTPQRIVVHRALRELDRHVTADELLDAVTDRLPSASPPPLPGTPLSHPPTDPHPPLVCTSCGAVEDLDAELESGAVERAAARHGFTHERV